MQRIPKKFYLRQQKIGHSGSATIIYIYRNYHGTVTGIIRGCLDARGARAVIRKKYKDAEFFKNN